jgi:hypothetical protein
MRNIYANPFAMKQVLTGTPVVYFTALQMGSENVLTEIKPYFALPSAELSGLALYPPCNADTFGRLVGRKRLRSASWNLELLFGITHETITVTTATTRK